MWGKGSTCNEVAESSSQKVQTEQDQGHGKKNKDTGKGLRPRAPDSRGRVHAEPTLRCREDHKWAGGGEMATRGPLAPTSATLFLVSPRLC